MLPETRNALNRFLLALLCLLLFLSTTLYAPPGESKRLTPFDLPRAFLFEFETADLPKAVSGMSKKTRDDLDKYFVKGVVYSWLLVELPPHAMYRNGFNSAVVSRQLPATARTIFNLRQRKVYKSAWTWDFNLQLTSVPPRVIANIPAYRGDLK